MKKIYFLMLAILAAVACTRNDLTKNDANGNPLAARIPALTPLVVDTGHWIITTNQASQAIEVYDPTVADWNTAAALKHSWYPNASNGFTNPTNGWGEPSDARLRQIGTTQYLGVTDSKGFCAEIPYPALTGKLWAIDLGAGVNPHAIELLPNGNVAIASADSNWVRIYTASQGTYSWNYNAIPYKLNQAHAALWDPGINRLWTTGEMPGVGKHILTALIIGGTAAAPTLTEDSSRRVLLPGFWGHDVQPYYGDTNKLLVSMNVDSAGTGGVYVFDKTTKTFTATTGGANRDFVKAISIQTSGQMIETTPSNACTLNAWSTPTVDFYSPSDTRTKTGACFYKARVFWWSYQ